jgi:hypothetical protein
METKPNEEEKPTPFQLWSRDEHGLINSAEYVFKEDGSVDWRKMIKPEFLYVNKEWFELRQKPVPTSIEGLEDKQLTIMLGGIKDLAKLRGFREVSNAVTHVREGYVSAECRIEWLPNYENPEGAYFSDHANASADNTDRFCYKFLEAIAVNRAFVRCVRNFLNINIVGADEIDKSDDKGGARSIDDEPSSGASSVHAALKKACDGKGLSDFNIFVKAMRALYRGALDNDNKSLMETLDSLKGCESFEGIDPKNCRKLLAVVNTL